MLNALRRHWHRFTGYPPGERFVSEHHAHQAERKSTWSRALTVGAGVAVIAVGVVALFVPGPGLLFIAFGAALVGRESIVVARGLDRTELWCRRIAHALHRWWQHASLLMKILVLIPLMAVAAGIAALLLHLAGVW